MKAAASCTLSRLSPSLQDRRLPIRSFLPRAFATKNSRLRSARSSFWCKHALGFSDSAFLVASTGSWEWMLGRRAGVGASPSGRRSSNASRCCRCFYDQESAAGVSEEENEWDSLLFGTDDENGEPNSSADDSTVRDSEEDRQLKLLVEKLEVVNKSMTWRKFSRVVRTFPYRMSKPRAIKLVKMLGERGSWQIAVNVIHWLEDRQGRTPRADKHIYTTLISIMGKKYPGSVLEIFDIMMKKGETYPDMPCYHAIAVALGRAGYLDELLQVMQILRSGVNTMLPEFKFSLKSERFLIPDNVVYNSVLNACASKKQWKSVNWVFQSMEKDGLIPDAATYGLAIEVMTRCGKTMEALTLVEEMKKSHLFINAKTYKSMISLMGETGQLSKAEEFVHEMNQRGIIVDATVYYSLANSYCKNGRWEDAINLIEKIRSFPDAEPLLVTYTNFIRTLFQNGFQKESIAVFDSMMQKKCFPNMPTYNLMLKVYGSEKSTYETAKSLFEDIRKGRVFGFPSLRGVVHHPGGVSYRISPDDDTFSCMLHACVNCGKWEDFRDVWWGSVRGGCHFRDGDYVYFLQQALKDGQTEISTWLLEKIETSIYFDEDVDENRSIKQMFRSGGMYFDNVNNIWKEEDEKVKQDQLSLLYEAKLLHSANSRKLESVLQLLDLIIKKNQFLETSTLLHVISSFRDCITAEESEKLMEKMDRIHCLPDRKVYLELIRTLLSKPELKNVKNALKVVSNMEKEGLEFDVGPRSSLIRCCFRVGLWKDAIKLYASGKEKGYVFSSTVIDMVKKSMSYIQTNEMKTQGLSSATKVELPKSYSNDSLPSPYEILDEWKKKKKRKPK